MSGVFAPGLLRDTKFCVPFTEKLGPWKWSYAFFPDPMGYCESGKNAYDHIHGLNFSVKGTWGPNAVKFGQMRLNLANFGQKRLKNGQIARSLIGSGQRKCFDQFKSTNERFWAILTILNRI